MLILGINTALKNSSVCLCKDGAVLEERVWEGNNNESKLLLPTIVEICKAHNFEPKNLGAIVVISGPGSFTALRIGVITANTLAAELKIPLFAVDSFRFLKWRSQEEFKSIVMHAGGNDIYVINQNDDEPKILDFDEWQKSASKGKYLLDLSAKQFIKLNPKIEQVKKMDGFGEFCVKIFTDKEIDSASLMVRSLPLSPNYIKPPSITI